MTACASGPPVVEPVGGKVGDNGTVVYVTGHDWHTGFVIPAADMQARFPALKTRFGNTAYLEFGWGDKDFYRAAEITAGLAAKAVLWPTESVMHVVAVPENVHGYFPKAEIHRLCLSPGRYAALINFIAGSFRRAADGAVIPLQGGLYGDSSFYEAVGNYTLFNTCNTWTAKGLKSAGFDITPVFYPRAAGITAFLREPAPKPDDGCGPGAERSGRGSANPFVAGLRRGALPER